MEGPHRLSQQEGGHNLNQDTADIPNGVYGVVVHTEPPVIASEVELPDTDSEE